MKQNGLQSKYRRKIKKKGLNIWTNAETRQDRSKSTNHKKIKTGAIKALVFFVAFLERGKRHLKIHFTNKEEDSGILPANNVVKTKKKG